MPVWPWGRGINKDQSDQDLVDAATFSLIFAGIRLEHFQKVNND